MGGRFGGPASVPGSLPGAGTMSGTGVGVGDAAVCIAFPATPAGVATRIDHAMSTMKATGKSRAARRLNRRLV